MQIRSISRSKMQVLLGLTDKERSQILSINMATLKSFLKILIGVQYERALQSSIPSPSSLRSATYPRGRGKG